MLKFYPVNDHIFIKSLTQEEEKTKSGILLVRSDASQRQLTTGLVYAISKSSIDYFKEVYEVEIKEGSIVTYSRYAGEDITVRPDKDDPANQVSLRDVHHESISSIVIDEPSEETEGKND